MSEDEFDIRPDLRRLAFSSIDSGDDLGFDCQSCSWSGETLPLNTEKEEMFEAVCPECGSEDVENLLSTAISEVNTIWSDEQDEEGEFVPLAPVKERFTGSVEVFDKALNHLLAHDDAYAAVNEGEMTVYLSDSGRVEG